MPTVEDKDFAEKLRSLNFPGVGWRKEERLRKAWSDVRAKKAEERRG